MTRRLPCLALVLGLGAGCGDRPHFELMIVSQTDQRVVSSGIFTDDLESCEELGAKYLSAYCNSVGPHANPMMAIVCEVPTASIVRHGWQCRPY